MTMMRRWQAVVPIKALSSAKTRIGTSPETRVRLAVAMCKDVVTAARQSPAVDRVWVVTSDPALAHEVRALGAHVWNTATTAGLNQDLELALASVPDSSGAVAIMADLGCLSSSLLTTVLDTAPAVSPSFVPDVAGLGTTMLLMPPGLRVRPRFGHNSAASHAEDAIQLAGDGSWFGARHDIDTICDLQHAARRGIGCFTSAAAWSLLSDSPSRDNYPSGPAPGNTSRRNR